MTKINQQKVNAITGSFEDSLHAKLKNKKAACAYLQVALDAYQEDQDKSVLLLALKDIADANGGVGWLAKETELNREHLYYLLSGKGNPKLDTITIILAAFGFHLKIAVC